MTHQSTISNNPNNLDIDKTHYVHGKTKLYVKKNGNEKEAVFDRFEQKNGKWVIYLTCIGEEKSSFYLFPNSQFVFTNKDDVMDKIDEEKHHFDSDFIGVDGTVEAFAQLPRAIRPLATKAEELIVEKQHHNVVDNKLQDDIKMQDDKIKNEQEDIRYADDAYKHELESARDDGRYVDEHTEIMHILVHDRASNNIKDAKIKKDKIDIIRMSPFFARIDLGKTNQDIHTAYIGKNAIKGYVVDWRDNQIALPYYQTDLFKRNKQCFLALERDIIIEEGNYKDYSDIVNNYGAVDSDEEPIYTEDQRLIELLQEGRSQKKIHDIIKSIQDEQYKIITSNFLTNEIVNGCAGSGKTMIMYHRLSYMAFNHERVFQKNSIRIMFMFFLHLHFLMMRIMNF